MKKIFNNKFFIDFIFLYIPLFLVEIIFRLVSGYTLLDLSLLRIGVGLFVITEIITYLLNFCKNVVTRVIQLIIICAASIYACAQLGFYNFLGMYISVQESSQLGAVTDYIKDFVSSFKWTYFLPLVVIVLYLVPTIIFRNRLKTLKQLSFKNNTLVSALIIVLSAFIYYGTLTMKAFNDKYQTTSNKDLFLTVSNTTNSITKFGSSTFALLDIRQKFFPITVEETFVSSVNNNNYYKNNESDLYEQIEGISDSEWKQIVAATEKKDYKSLNEYFMSLPKEYQNEYTGMFEGKNVIFILMESVNDIIVEYPEYYPNFAKILEHSFYFKNNYSPRNACATLNNEFSGMTSLYSVSKVCTGKEYINNTYFQSVFNLYNEQNYVTFSAHDYTEAYYPRKKFHTNMGSGEYYGVQKLKISYSNEYINWANDDEFLAKVNEIIKEKRAGNQKFMTWLTTVSSHQPYSVSSIQGDKYYSMTKGKGIPEDVRRFMSKLKIVDNALGVLLEGLEEQGILNDTVIVLYGDHYPYGISTNHLNKVLSYDTAEDKNAERVPLAIYNPAIEGKVFEQYTTYVNILPTIANLFNLDYDPRLMLGNDMLSKNYESLVVFADGSWKNENAYYDASSRKVKYYNDEYTEEDTIMITKNVSTKLKVSTKAIETNYFNYLNDILSKVEKTQGNMTPIEIETNTCDNSLSS